MNTRTPDRSGSERGAVLIIVALAITALFLIVAIVIDLGATRSDRRGGQVAVDNAVSSSTKTFYDQQDIIKACETAFDYLRITLDVAAFTGDDCAAELSGTCIPANPRPVEKESGVYTAVFHNPVPDASSIMKTSTIGSKAVAVEDHDGSPCERVGLQLTTTGDSFFGGIAGADERTSVVSAVGRIRAGNKRFQALNMLVLERHDCDAFTVSGNNTQVIISAPSDDPTTPLVDESTLPGIAASDSDARDCSGQNATVEVSGNGGRLEAQGICADVSLPANSCGEIQLFAGVNDGSCASSGVDRPACDEGQGSIAPDASNAVERFTRAAVDHRYNCKTSYTTEPWYTELEQDIGPCRGADASSVTNYVDRLERYVVDTVPSWPNVISGSACNADTFTYPFGNYYVNCDTFRVNAGASVTFAGGNVAFSGNVTVQNDSSLTIHDCAGLAVPTCPDTLDWAGPNTDFNEAQSSSEAAWAYAEGIVTVSGSGTLRLNHTALFMGSGGSIAQSGVVHSTAPDNGGVTNAAGPFDDLALWSEGTSSHSFRGGGASYFEGLYFGGRAHFALSGGTDVELKVAQFVSNTITFSGGVRFDMSPDGRRSVLFETQGNYSLIR